MTEPTISIGSSETTERVVRTGVQALSPALIVEGLRVFHVWEPEPQQLAWVLGASPVIIAYVQNAWEKARGRKFIGKST